MYILRYIILPFLVTLATSTALTFAVRKATKKLGLLDKPGRHKQHEEPTPTLGGVSVFLSFLIGCSLCGPLSPQIQGVILASCGLVAVGLIDDVIGVSANLKLLALGAASWYLWKIGVHLDVFGSSGLLALILTFLWIGLVSSAFNGVDNADGAAGGLAVISCTATFAISWVTWQHDLAIISLTLAASCCGFLIFNYPRPKASIFLGDSGSLFLGFGLSVLAILGQWSDVGWKSAVIAFTLVIVPLADFCFILVSRGIDGRYQRWDDPIKMCARDHTFHRLKAAGFSSVGALWCLYGLALIFALLAYYSVTQPDAISAGMILRWLGLLLLFFGYLKSVKLPDGAFPGKS